jgi:hypothetical protein
MAKKSKSKKGTQTGFYRYESKTMKGYKLYAIPKMVRLHGAPLDPKGQQMRRTR